MLTEVAWLLAEGMAVEDALADCDPEALARNIVITSHDDCRRCDTDVAWITAAWEPRETEAPIGATTTAGGGRRTVREAPAWTRSVARWWERIGRAGMRCS